MAENKSDRIETIKLYRVRLNLQDATFVRIEHKDAFVATVYKVTLSTGKELILKICLLPRHYFRELYCLNYFAGKLPVPRIIDTMQPEEGVKATTDGEFYQNNKWFIEFFLGKPFPT